MNRLLRREPDEVQNIVEQILDTKFTHEKVVMGSQKVVSQMGTMIEELKSKIIKVLKKVAGDKAEIRIEEMSNGKLSGFVISNAFENIGPNERQEMLWKKLNKVLTRSERFLITFVVMDTPNEYRILSNGDW